MRDIVSFSGGNAVQHVGIAADETKRVKDDSRIDYPLARYGITEEDALSYCKGRGFDWGGLYDKFDRVSCFCCPLQKIGDLRTIRADFPQLWQRMIMWDCEILSSGDAVQSRFRSDYSLLELDKRFRTEEAFSCSSSMIRR